MGTEPASIRILALCGSLGRSSSNLTLLQKALELTLPDTDLQLFPPLDGLPHFNPDLERDSGSIAAVGDLRQRVKAADAVLIATPEYGFSLPGTLKNAIDWLIGSGELEQKVVAVTASVPHPERGRGGIEALLVPLRAVSAQVVFAEPLVRDATQTDRLRSLISDLAAAARAAHQTSGGE